MSEAPAPLHRRRTPRQVGVVADPAQDLAEYSDLMDRVPAGSLKHYLMNQHRDELLERVLGPRPELDLHLDGAGVQQHTTDMEPLGKFLRALDAVAKAVAKSHSGRKRLHGSLRVTPSLGSVRLVVEPPDTSPEGDGTPTERVEHVETAALRKLVLLMNVAETETDVDGSTLGAALHDLNPTARGALARFAKVAHESSYELSGLWLDPRNGSAEVALSLAAAHRLERAAREKTEQVDTETAVGEVDGWEWSSGTVTFIPRHGRRFRASVPDELATEVAHIGASRGNAVLATFVVVTTYNRGSKQPGPRGYSLSEIKPIDAKR